jgi:hypothetical protein
VEADPAGHSRAVSRCRNSCGLAPSGIAVRDRGGDSDQPPARSDGNRREQPASDSRHDPQGRHHDR